MASLNPRDKIMFQKLTEFLHKKMLEGDRTQGNFVGNPEKLLEEFLSLAPLAESESAAAAKGYSAKDPGDYLWAEALGYRVEEWRNLFVPDFLGAHDLLSNNTTILTGARGCGKTMVFRRLTAFMDKVIGGSSGVKNADRFVGFYLNCRNFVEAFPWMPRKLSRAMEQQSIHYFHLAWLSEVCKTLAIRQNGAKKEFSWLGKFVGEFFGESYRALPSGGSVLNNVRAFLEEEKERCRLAPFGKKDGLKHWPLARLDILDKLQCLLETKVGWIGGRPLYLFLDDYTFPIVPRALQRILNSIIFKRRDKIFFKVASESSNSFEREDSRGKPLELHHDFELVDLATECIHQDTKTKCKLLDRIFGPRMKRHERLQKGPLTLRELLGSMKMSSNKLAWKMREAARSGSKKKIRYHGIEAFAGMWTSDVRSLIQMFSEMLRESEASLRAGVREISPETQDKVFRTAGGEFLVFAEAVCDPDMWEIPQMGNRESNDFGRQLKDIVEAFVGASRFEMTHGNLVKNQGNQNPKQAFRIEIIDKFDLSGDAHKFYQGIVRWHIFLQDRRGKSTRGMITPRLYLNRILLPYCNLTFSSHDNLQLTNDEFAMLLGQPKGFSLYWEKKRAGATRSRRRRKADTGPTFWDKRKADGSSR